MDLKELVKDYLWIVPLIATVLGASIGYFWGQRTKKQERLFNQTYESLKDVCSPMYHEMKLIFREPLIEKRDSGLEDFFTRYKSIQTDLFKIGNIKIIQEFYIVENLYLMYTQNPTKEHWVEFWYNFQTFYNLIESEYSTNLKALYGEYRWNRKVNQKEPLMKLLIEVCVSLLKLSRTATLLSVLSIYLGIWDFFLVKKVASVLIYYGFFGLIMSLLIWFTCRGFSSEYVTLTDNGFESQNIIQLIMSKIFPNRMKKVSELKEKKQKEKVKQDIQSGKVVMPEMSQKEKSSNHSS